MADNAAQSAPKQVTLSQFVSLARNDAIAGINAIFDRLLDAAMLVQQDNQRMAEELNAIRNAGMKPSENIQAPKE